MYVSATAAQSLVWLICGTLACGGAQCTGAGYLHLVRVPADNILRYIILSRRLDYDVYMLERFFYALRPTPRALGTSRHGPLKIVLFFSKE